MGEAFTDELDTAGIMLGAVPAVHGREDAVGAGLQRDVEVLGEAIGRGKEFNEVFRDVQRFDGADAKALNCGFTKNPAEEVFEFDTRRKVAAIGAEVDPAEDDFLISGFAEIPDFLNDGFRGKAPASSADTRNHTVRAARVTSILNFQGRARVAPFPAENRSGKQGFLFDYATVHELDREGGK